MSKQHVDEEFIIGCAGLTSKIIVCHIRYFMGFAKVKLHHLYKFDDGHKI